MIDKTIVRKRNLNPVWNATFSCPLMHFQHTLLFEVMDEDSNKDDALGQAKVDLASEPLDSTNDHTLKLEQMPNTSIVVRGTLSVVVEIVSNLGIIRIQTSQPTETSFGQAAEAAAASHFSAALNLPDIFEHEASECARRGASPLGVRDALVDAADLLAPASRPPAALLQAAGAGSARVLLAGPHVPKLLRTPREPAAAAALFAWMSRHCADTSAGDFYVQIEILSGSNLSSTASTSRTLQPFDVNNHHVKVTVQ